MPAQIDSMMYVGQKPWHGLGVDLKEAPRTGREALLAAGLDWSVELQSLNIASSGLAVEHKAVVRTDKVGDESVLGVVGPNYRPLQNDAVAELFDPLIQDGSIEIETAGSLQGGARVWMLGKIGSDMEIERGDVVKKYLLLGHAHDGTLAVRFGFTPIRVVCSNTLSLAVNNESSRLVKCLHTTNLERNLRLLRDSITTSTETFELAADSYRKLAATGVSRADLKEYARIVIGCEGQDDKEWTGRERTKVREIVAAAIEGRGNRGSNWWHAYNGATEWLTHSYGKNNETRLNHNWFGPGSKTNTDALRLAIQMAG